MPLPSNYIIEASDERCYPNPPRSLPSYQATNLNQHNENEPLLRIAPTEAQQPSLIFKVIFTLILIIGLETGYLYGTVDSINPRERANIRKNWELEYAALTRNITRLTTECDTKKSEWNIAHDRLLVLRDEFSREQQKFEEERQQWEEERRKNKEEEHERQREYIRWGALRKDKEPCVSYGTARYQATLEYIPRGWEAYMACKETPIQIHGKSMLPDECRHIGGEMVGIWVIDFDEPACKPWWRDTKDHGCTSRQSGIHRYEAHLEGYLEPNEFKARWSEMCGTTPHTMFGHTYQSPTECIYWPGIGVYGFWDVPDQECR